MPLDSVKIEGVKLLFDTFKHLTTLSVGSIVILATFLKDISSDPKWTMFAGGAIVLFLLSILASLSVMLVFTKIIGEEGLKGKQTIKTLKVGFFFSVISFIFAVCSL